MKIWSKKGFVLPIAIFFVALAILTSIGIYTNGYFVTKELRVHETSYVRGYFLAVAGLRFACLRLQDPTTLSFTSYSVTLDNNNSPGYNTFINDLGLAPNEGLAIMITEWYSGCGWNPGEYQASATYSS